jgi:DNA-binding protein HU-beta
LNRRELVLALAERTETDRRTADETLTALLEIITETVASGDPVAISGFAKFARVDRPARMGRNPATGETIRIKATRRVRITALKAFKDAAISGKAPARKSAPAKKTAATKTAAKKAPAKKTVAKKTVAKKTVAKKTVAKKTVAKKTTTKKTAAKKTVARKAAPRR